jgi:hypothetical protein
VIPLHCTFSELACVAVLEWRARWYGGGNPFAKWWWV